MYMPDEDQDEQAPEDREEQAEGKPETGEWGRPGGAKTQSKPAPIIINK
ncbi:MAG: hypothetical protein JSS41_09205 [Proteobacteria bacterium]|nr:hypothetical protein [Pseudomonadota bacterium]